MNDLSFRKNLAIAAVLIGALLTGCAAREVLVMRSSTVPVGIDFSGKWVLRDESNDTINRMREAEIHAAGGRDAILSAPVRRRRDNGSLVYVFLETGRNLKITQTRQGLFISFDRSIVEEYRFGEHRQINVGPVSADRSSGFEGRAYVIETLDREGSRLIDRYELVDDGKVLLRQITIFKKNMVHMSLVQKFDKA